MAANTQNGRTWPPEAAECPADPSRHFANSDGNGMVIPPKTETTYILTNYWGLRDPSRGGYFIPDGWTKFPLWVKESEYSNLGFESETDANTVFYYMDYTWGGALSVPEEHWAKVGQYSLYKAKTGAQIDVFNAATKLAAASGLAEQGGHGYPPEVLAAHGPAAQVVGEALLAVSEAANAVSRRDADARRTASYKAWDRSAMHRIAESAELSAPKTQWHHGVLIGSTPGALMLEVRRALIDAGYSKTQISWYLEGGVTGASSQLVNPADLKFYGPDFFPRRGEETEPPEENITQVTPARTRITVRAPLGYAPVPGRHSSNQTEMVQSYKGSSNLQLANRIDRFVFPVTPNNISYSGLGSRWIEIPRKGHFPIVEWADWVLMKVQFDFLLAHEMDGLFRDVRDYIEQLQRMSQRQAPVSIYGLDQLFSLQMKRAHRTGQAMQFVIADFSIKSAARTILEGNKEITSAQCSMTLQEIPIEQMTIVDMTIPPLSESALPPGDAAVAGGGVPGLSTDLDAVGAGTAPPNQTPPVVATTDTSGADDPEYGYIDVPSLPWS